MIVSKALAAHSATDSLHPFSVERRDPSETELQIKILYCGICHSDLHMLRNEWRSTVYPLVPGHEIVGRVEKCGNSVSRFKVGDLVGVGCMVDSCRSCPACESKEEQFCHKGFTATYNSQDLFSEGKQTYGGYSQWITVDEAFSLKVSESLDTKAVPPLLCAGITTYSPIKRWGVQKGHKLGVVGLGGLGHMAVKIGKAFGAEVTVFSRGEKKKEDALRLGADNYVDSTNEENMKSQAGSYDFILNTVSANHHMTPYLHSLKVDGQMVLVGVPEHPASLEVASLIFGRHSVKGSLIGGIQETQEMLDFCAQKQIVSDVEVVGVGAINEAMDRLQKSDVKYRFVIDASTF